MSNYSFGTSNALDRDSDAVSVYSVLSSRGSGLEDGRTSIASSRVETLVGCSMPSVILSFGWSGLWLMICLSVFLLRARSDSSRAHLNGQ